MKRILPVLASLVPILAPNLAHADSSTPPPNVVIIYGDDVGWGDVGAYGAKQIPTPRIDQLASEGLRFTDGYCAASTCTPSRFSLLVGEHGFRRNIKILDPPKGELIISSDDFTLPKLFKKAGYQTAVIGKWHLGIGEPGKPIDWNGALQGTPLDVGFDRSFIIPATNDRVPCVYLDQRRVANLDPKDPIYVTAKLKKPDGFTGTVYPDGKQHPEAMNYFAGPPGMQHRCSVINGIGRIGYMWGGKSALWDDEEMTDLLVGKVRNYLTRERDKTKPFFLFYAAQNIHGPSVSNPRFHGKSGLGHRGDSMVEFDWAVGEILDLLKAEGLAENTIVIFSSDNGPVYEDGGYQDGSKTTCGDGGQDGKHDGSGPWRGGKYEIHEGGPRVPFIVRWPARIKPGITNTMFNQVDFLATFANLLGQPLPEGQAIDSRPFLPALLGIGKGPDFILTESFNAYSLRVGPWKYFIRRKHLDLPDDKGSLHNLDKDPDERNNLVDQLPERAQAMRQQLQTLVKAKKGIRSLSTATK